MIKTSKYNLTKVILLYKNGDTEQLYLPLTPRINQYLEATDSVDKYSEELQAFLFTPKSFLYEMVKAEQNKLF